MLHGRMIGVDTGNERTGVAVSDDEGRMAVPLTVVVRRGRAVDWVAEEVAAAARAAGAKGFVVGLPLNMDGSEGMQAVKARAFGRRLQRLTRLPVEYQDERLSSFAVEHALHAAPGRRRSARPVDDLVAARILQSYLDAGARQNSAATGGDEQ